MDINDTIAAIATPAGKGGIGIVRVSGAKAHETAAAVFRAKSGEDIKKIKGYTARLGNVVSREGTIIDEAVALVYREPKSYTGEDAVEIMCHGGEIVCENVLAELIAAGAVMAGPGEFTRRALVNGRLTLTEAEAVCDLINAASRQGGNAAAALQSGALYRKTVSLKERILEIQVHITAYIDFPEEDVDEIDLKSLQEKIETLKQQLEKLLASYDVGASVLRGVPAVIAGSPNVGKSTLLNLLSGSQKAIVTPIAGTTRDVVEQQIRLGGTTLILADTAGIRESADEIEKLGIERAVSRVDEASLVLAVFDASRSLDEDDRRVIVHVKGKRVVAVVNKTDLEQKLDTEELEKVFGDIIYISANDESAIAELDAAVARAVEIDKLDPDEPLLANERQRGCARRAQSAVAEAAAASRGTTLDVVYALLGEALEALAELSGENMTETVLDEVFSRFCVGK